MKREDPDYRVDSAGERRRLCDFPCKGQAGYHEPAGRRCAEYARRRLDDGRFVCGAHDPDRKVGWLMCSQRLAHDQVNGATRGCQNRGVFQFNDAQARAAAGMSIDGVPDEWRWYCKRHDPGRSRCENPSAHPPGPFFQREVVAGRLTLTKGGPKVCPRAPSAVRRLFGIALCADCAKPGQARKEARDREPREVRPPCCLCSGAGALEDDAGRFFPCLCTPGGRQLANGGLNDAQVAAALAADCTVAFILESRGASR